MIPKVSKGRSFLGAGRYYLHDKRLPGETERYTDERVDFIHTVNLPTSDGWKAVKWMAHTAMRQDALKAAAIARGEDISLKGRKSQFPVYAYSLSWHPEQTPSREEMLEAAIESLKVNDLDKGYEALMVAHNDEPHPHIHVIVNRVHPENGIMAPLSRDFLKLSQWAERYERNAGKIYCEQRVENNERRRQGYYAKDTRSVFKSDFYRWRAEQTKKGFEHRQAESQGLSETHKAQRDHLYEWKENLIRNRREEMKEERKPLWADLYKKQAWEKEMLRRDREADWSKANYFTSHRDADALNRRRIISDAFNELNTGEDRARELEHRHEQERLAMASFFKEQTKTEFKTINDGYRRRLDEMKRKQRKERKEQEKRHSRESQERAIEITKGADEEKFDHDLYTKKKGWKRKREEFRDVADELESGRQRERTRKRRGPKRKKPPDTKA